MIISLTEQLGKKLLTTIHELGYTVSLFTETCYWLMFGHFLGQKIKLQQVVNESMRVGVNAILIVSILCFSVGVMLAIQGIETLKLFGAESKVIFGITFSMTREFSPLIIGILIAGRSGSAITAKIGTMMQTQEIDALRVMGVNPVRYLVSPVLLAMVIMLPSLTLLGDVVGIAGGGLYSILTLVMSMAIYIERTLDVLSFNDLFQGLAKSFIFAFIITIISASNGFQVTGGAEGVGIATTRSVVLSISSIIMADMLFTFMINS